MVYVPDSWNPQAQQHFLALHYALHPAWIRVHWHDRHQVSLIANDQYPVITPSIRDVLCTLTERMQPTRRDRRQWLGKDLYVGHRATRQRGLTAATHKFRHETERLNHYVSTLLPQARWNALGVLEHMCVPQHPDDMSDDVTHAIAISQGSVTLTYESPLTRQECRVSMCRRVCVFLPQRPHRVHTDRTTRTITLYNTKRDPIPEHRSSLEALGFLVLSRVAHTPLARRQMSPTPPPSRPTRPCRGPRFEHVQTGCCPL